MCCNDDENGQTRMRGPTGTPVGFESFMAPGGPFGGEDVLGAIYARMGLPEEGSEAPPPMANPDDEEVRQAAMVGGLQ